MAMKSWVGHTMAMKRRRRTTSITAEMVVAAHLLVFLVLIGGGCCFSGCRSAGRLCSSRTRARAAAAVMYVNTIALTAPSMITMSNGRPMLCMSRASCRRRIAASAARRRRGVVSSEMTDSPWSTTGFNQACDGLSNDEGDNEHGYGNEHAAPEEVGILGQDEPRQDSWTSTGWDEGTNGVPYSSRDQTEPAAPAFGGFEGEGNLLGSPEFVALVKAQFEVLATALDASEIVLYVRRENAEPGALEYVPALEYPERANGMQVQGGGNGLSITGNAARVLPHHPLIPVRRTGDDWNAPEAVEDDNGGLSAPIMYASLVLGMITMWKRDRHVADQPGEKEVGGKEQMPPPGTVAPNKQTAWTKRDKTTLEKVCSSITAATVLDQKQRWAAVTQVEQLGRVLSESLKQVKKPITALRTFGKLLIGRLPREDTINRELATDIILQSDRLVDVLLPVDAVIGLLAHTAESVDSTNLGDRAAATGNDFPQIEGLAATRASTFDSPDGATIEASQVPEGAAAAMATKAVAGITHQGVEDALLSPSQGEERARLASAGGTPRELKVLPPTSEEGQDVNFLVVQDVVEPIARAAQVTAREMRVRFRWRVDGNLPGVIGSGRALEEALSSVLENAFKRCTMGPGRDRGENRATVLLRARPNTGQEWGSNRGVVIQVVDNGPGLIEQDDSPQVLDEDDRRRRLLDDGARGRGPGLGSARRIMRSFGGDLQVAQKEEGGWRAGVKLFIPINSHRGGEEGGVIK